MKKLLLTIITLLSLNNSYAQLPNGSVAPDWTLTDLNGTSHNLYTYLNNGYTVFIDFSAVWCPPCWSYHQSGALENLYIDHGPAGAPNVSPTTTDDVMVFFIEGDAGTLAQLNGGSGSQGDWVTGTPYPIIPTYAGSNSTQVTSDYQIGYWPTIYMVCPDKLITESGTSSNPYSLVSTCLPPATYNNDATFSYTGETVTCEGDLTPEIMIQNYGLLNLTSLSIEVKVNGTSQSVTPWLGNLATYAMDNVTLPTLIGLANNDLVTIEVSLPNGVADQDPSNNPTISFNTSLAIQNTNINVTVNITTDAYGSETTWDLKNSTGQTIISGGPYNDLSAAGTTTQTPTTTTLSGQECHTFTIYDSYGDGINAGYGAGFFTVIDGNGTTLVSGGVFTYENKGTFKTENTSTPSWDCISGTCVDPGTGNGLYSLLSVCQSNCAIYGCTDSTAINYNPLATIDDSSCVYCNIISSLTATNISVTGANDGIITTLAPSGGTGPYTYSWVGPSGFTSTTQNLINLAAGTYTLTITDAIGCTLVLQEVINVANCNVIITDTYIAPSCYGYSGSLTWINSGGVPPYDNYMYNPSTGVVIVNHVLYNSPNTPLLVPVGVYDLIVTDASNCQQILSLVVTAPDSIIVNVTASDASCFGSNDGIATVTPTGGTAPYTYLWNTGQTTATATGLISGTYSCNITDANGCTVNSGPIVVNQPTAIISSLTATAITSTGANDGIITTLAPSGGTGPYTYSWVGPSGFTSTTQNLINLAAGTYTLTITDAIGCTLVLQEVINVANCNVIITDTYIAPSCYGYSGSLTWINSGGVPPYDNYMYNPSTGVVIVNHVLYNSPNTPLLVPVGVYDLIVTDASNCQQILSLVVTAPDSIIVNVTASDASCFGSNDGIATVTPTGGTAPYTYLWNNGQTTATATGLIAGTYWWTTNDANFCTQTSGTIVVSQPSQIAVTTSTTLVSCYGACDGTASVNVSGGTAPYTYLWSPSGQTTPTIVGLCPSAYFVSVVDANGCTIFYPFVINEPNALIANVTTTNVSCFSANDGSIIATTSGGVPPYQYSLDGGLSQSNGTFTGLSPATYWVDITDANGCMIYQTVVITEPPALNITATVTNVSCFGMCDGSSSVSVTGGTPTYNYSWSNGQTAPTITNLCAGTYVCAVADVNNCITQSTVIVAEPAPLSISVDSTDETSALNDGSATAFVLGGSWPYTYIWSNGGTTNPQVNLAPGLYTVTVTDANGCVISEATSVNAYNPTGVINIQNTKQTLLKITDMLGQETPYRRNTPLFYIYDDGTVEKRIVIE